MDCDFLTRTAIIAFTFLSNRNGADEQDLGNTISEDRRPLATLSTKGQQHPELKNCFTS